VADERAGVDIPDDGNFMAVQVKLRRFRRAPVGGYLRKLPDDQRFDIRPGRLLVFKICANVSDVGVGKADDLAGVAGVGENFLITGEAGIENDFAAAARDGARGASVKEAPVFQRKCRGSVRNFGQRILLSWFSCKFAIHLVFASVVSSEPKWSTGQ
jgi:hypothetical protein